MNVNQFQEIKDKYKDARKNERDDLRKLLKLYLEKSFDGVVKKGSQGSKAYTRKRSIAKYDLTNWMYIEGSFYFDKRYWHFIIELQSIDQDPVSKNVHILMDRISVMVDEIHEKEHLTKKNNSGNGRYTKQSYSLNDWANATTDIDLPLNINLTVEENKIFESNPKAMNVIEQLFNEIRRT